MIPTTLKTATLFLLLSTGAFAAENDWSKVAAALGKSGTEMPGGVYRVGLPRTDLHVTLDGVVNQADARSRILARVSVQRRCHHGHGRPRAHRG